jgi:hypothetical protein
LTFAAGALFMTERISKYALEACAYIGLCPTISPYSMDGMRSNEIGPTRDPSFDVA